MPDGDESDTFILSGTDDLAPLLEPLARNGRYLETRSIARSIIGARHSRPSEKFTVAAQIEEVLADTLDNHDPTTAERLREQLLRKLEIIGHGDLFG